MYTLQPPRSEGGAREKKKKTAGGGRKATLTGNYGDITGLNTQFRLGLIQGIIHAKTRRYT